MTHIYAVYKRPTSEQKIHTDWIRDGEIFHANGNGKKAGGVIFIPDKIDFKTKAITRGKDNHYIMLKVSIQQKDITLINVCAPNIGAPEYIKKISVYTEGEIDSNIIIAGILIPAVVNG